MNRIILTLLVAIFALPSPAQELVKFRKNWEYGFKDSSGKVVIEPNYDEAFGFSEGLAAVKKDDKWGYIDKTGKIVFPFCYDFASPFSEGLAYVKRFPYHWFIDKTGNKAIKDYYYGASDFSEGLAAVKLNYKPNDKWGFIDKTGKMIIQPYYDNTRQFSEGLAAVKQNDKWGFIDKTGKMIVQPYYDDTRQFSEGLAAVKQYDKWGFIDRVGNMVVQPVFGDVKWDDSLIFKEGLTAIRVNNKYGYIDKSGEFVIQPVYDDAWQFKKGLAQVKQNDEWGYIDRKGSFYKDKSNGERAVAAAAAEEARFAVTFAEFLRQKGLLSESEIAAQVEAEVKAWQTKGEFETTAAWQQRVNEQTRAAKVKEIVDRISAQNNQKVADAAAEYCAHRAKRFADQTIELKPYDADNQTYLISTEKYGDILLPVPIADAPAFKQNWTTIKRSVEAKFVPAGNDVALQSVAFGKYVYDANTSANYAQVEIDYNFRPIDIASLNLRLGDLGGESATAVVTPRHVEPERKSIGAGSVSDVDRNIPTSANTAARTFALVIANSNYRHASKVATAENDGKIFTSYLRQTLGLPAENITTLHDATLGDIAAGISHLQDIARAYSREPFSVLLYYVGHGLPDDDNREAYILPVDASPRNTRVCYPLKSLYEELGELGAESVTVIIDACFSGAGRGDGMLVAQSMGVAIAPKAAAPQGNMVVLAAAQGDETAFPYAEQNHGLFTYWLLKKLQQSEGRVTLGELADYVTDNVSKTSVLKNRKPQTPSVAISPSMQSTWRTRTLIQ